jgi:chromosome segregation ATPase
MDKARSEIKSFMHRKKAQLKRLEAEVEDLRAEMESSPNDEGLVKVISDDLDEIRARVAGRMADLEKAGRESASEVRNSAEEALEELRRGLSAAREKIREA